MAHQSYEDCIEACHACADACEHCADACLAERDVQKLAECIRLDQDCAAFCRLAAVLMARDSRFATELCLLCAKVCESCAVECEKHDMEHCRMCAEACRKCADECRRMASGAPATQQSAVGTHA